MEKRIIPCGSKYESQIYVIDEIKEIYKLDCNCPDFKGIYVPKKIKKETCRKFNLCGSCLIKENKEGCSKEFDKIYSAKFYPGKRIIKSGQFSDIKYFSIPCKHLKPFVERLENIGYTLKKPKQMEGSDKLSAALRKKLLERANNHCEALVMGETCQSAEGLQVHRKVRGSSGGKYNESNCKVLCWEHHRGSSGVHANEFRSCQG